MRETYLEAMEHLYEDEGGYTNDAQDSGGPTNWGITIHDARMYWKKDATANDVRHMPKSVAADIYRKHYANPLRYDELPAGVDYTVLDYGINSGIGRSARILQHFVGVPADGIIGPITLAAVAAFPDHDHLIDLINDERMRFLRGLRIWGTFGRGWRDRVEGKSGVRATSHHMSDSPTLVVEGDEK